MDVALSKNGARLLRAFFCFVVIFLYAPIVILLIFSFNDSPVPTFPLSGFTFHWYRDFLENADLRSALETSALIAVLSSIGAVVLGVLASLALTRRRFRGKAAVSALLLSPLVIPYLVFGISLLLLFHRLGVPRSVLTVVIGHIVISLPYTILVLLPRLQQIDVSLEEAAFDLGAIYELGSRFAVDGGIQIGVSGNAPDLAAFGGLSIIVGDVLGKHGVHARQRHAQERPSTRR